MYHLLNPRKRIQTQTTLVCAARGVTSFSTHRSHVACPCCSLHGVCNLSHAIGSYYCALFAHFAHNLPFVEDELLSDYIVNLLMSPGADYHCLDVALPLVDVNLIPPSCALNPNLFLIRSSSFPQTAPIVRTSFDLNPKQDWVLAQQAQTMNL